MRKAYLMPLVTALLVFNTIQAKTGNFKETYDARDEVKIECDLGSLALTSNASGVIEVECDFDLSGNTSYQPSVTVEKSCLTIEGKLEGSRSNKYRAEVNWTISIPPGTNVEFETSTGSVSIEKFQGEFIGTTESGGIEIGNSSGKFSFKTDSGNLNVDNSSGAFKLTSGSGSVNASEVILTDMSEFRTKSGDVLVSLSESPDADISIWTTSGDATLDYDGSEVRGYFEMSALKDRDYIDCPFVFDNEWYERMGGPGTSEKVTKAFIRGSSTPLIKISAVSGRAILRD